VTEYKADIAWARDGADFVDKRYSRRHTLRFDGGLEVPASASPTIVPEPMSDPRAMDPEEGFVAALASCHLLWFLAIAAERGFRVDSYSDSARGVMARNSEGRPAITQVVLSPSVRFSGEPLPSRAQVIAMHDAAHERCFIANSVTTEIRCEPVF